MLFVYSRALLSGFFLFFIVVGVSYGQSTVVTTKNKEIKKTVDGTVVSSGGTVTVNLNFQPISDALPFDVPFYIVGGDHENANIKLADVQSIECWYGEKKIAEKLGKHPTRAELNKSLDYSYDEVSGMSKQYSLYIKGLKANRDYTFWFRVSLKTDVPLDIKKEIEKSVQGMVDAAFKNKAGHYEFDVDDLNKRIRQVVSSTEEDLQFKGINVDFRPITDKELPDLQTVVLDFTDAQQRLKGMKMQLGGRIAVFKTNRLQSMKDYQVDHQSSSAAGELLDIIKTIEGVCEKLTQDSVAINPDKKVVADSIIKYLKDTIPRLLPADSSFAKVRKELTDGIGELEHDFNELAAQWNNTLSIETSSAAEFVSKIKVVLFKSAYLTGSTVPAEFRTRANLYISADLGVAVVPEISQVLPYLGTNIYLAPVNKKYPLTFRKLDFFKRFSFLVGLSVVSVNKNAVRSDLLSGAFNLITGSGFRIADFVRLNGGMVWYLQNNPNPLNSNKKMVGSPFVSLSFDIDVKTVFNNLFASERITSITPQ